MLAARGPLCVLAGAGTGKTRTITHRIPAHLVANGHVAAGRMLAVTFTSRAAGEMRSRLRAMDVGGVQALTFHAAARRQLVLLAAGGRRHPTAQLLDKEVRRGGPGRQPGPAAGQHRRRP